MNRKRYFYLSYTLLFMMLAGLLVYFYYSQGMSLIDFMGDGFRQHYRAMLYTSDILKTIFSNIFVNHSFIIPQWDFSLGEGSDILQTLHYYGVSDAVLLPSVLVPDRYMYMFYDFIALFRMYLSGLAFAGLCFYAGKRNYTAVLSGSLLYAFCNFAMTTVTGHTFFLSALIWLPMIIKGVEKIIRGEKGAYLSISVCLSSLSNIYFFYMNVLSTVFYVIVRLLTIKKDNKEKLNAFLGIALHSLIGLLMSAVVALPLTSSMLGNARLSTHTGTSLLYDAEEYIDLFTRFAFGYKGYWGSYSVLALIALTYLFRRKGSAHLKILFIMALVIICVPFLASLYNAMMYATNRWAYCIALLISYIITDMLEDHDDLKLTDFIPGVVYLFICVFLDMANIKLYALAFIFLGMIAAALKLKRNMLRLVSLCVVIMSIAFSIVYHYSPLWWNYVRNGTELDTVYDETYPDLEILDSIEDESFFRYSGDSLKTNSSVNNRYYSGQYYWSVANNDVIEMRKQLGLPDHNNHHYDSYDGRFILNALSSTKYYLKENAKDSCPYGFTPVNKKGDQELYESSYALPLLYGYQETVSADEWLKYDLVGRQQVLTKKAVLEESTHEGQPVIVSNKNIPYEMDSSDVSFNGNEITVLDPSAWLDLKVSSTERGEYYLVVEGMDSDTSTNWLIIDPEGHEKLLFFKDDEHTANADKHDFLIGLGCYDGLQGTVRIALQYTGTYAYRQIRIVCQPLDEVIDDLQKLDCLNISGLQVTYNSIRADIDADSDVLLCAAVPYAKGWKAWLDGKQVEIKKVNLMYMGMEVEKGHHVLEMKYSSPLMKEGLIISIMSSAVCLYLLFRKRNKENE